MAYIVKRRLKGGNHAYLVRYHGPDGRTHLNSHLLPRFGDVPLSRIQNSDIRTSIA